MIPASPNPLFQSFWMAGFECSCHINYSGRRLDMMAAVQHDLRAAEDYALLREIGISTARDGVRWHLIDRAGRYNWSSWIPMLQAARRNGVQVIWDLCHYGWPDGLDIFSARFPHRFARFAARAAQVQREQSQSPGFFVPVNEISFFTWAATRKLMYPYARGRDSELKRQLVRSAIEAVDAIRSVDPEARIVLAEPLIYTVPPRTRPHLTGPAEAKCASQFEAFDMIAGRAAPELGGAERYLDIIGVNYYAANQWEVPGGHKLHWDAGSDDPRWMPLHKLLAAMYARYQRPLFIAETSHYGSGRAAWLEEIACEANTAIGCGVPLEGICLYPILDRFDWNHPRHWHHAGMWDLKRDRAGDFARVLHRPYALALQAAQTLVSRPQSLQIF
jgi:beta-glucosidase/6-phospho-beta-glucosidase/beta-galactosidase